ncbi:hypothetical protein BJ170DRAFT_605124 [Xylariales sp. AK1849]|nr:hypothetical protein BJ170DRAFT_605124 [Xylariales sp. AK1849]
MLCPCRTSSLRIFIQSIARIQLSGHTPRPAHRFSSTSLGVCPRNGNGSVRSFTAASTASYPRQPWRTPSRDRTISSDSDEQSRILQNEDLIQDNVNSTSDRASNALAGELEKARSQGSILDFSPEAIDALAAEIDHTSVNDTFPDAEQTVNSNQLTRVKPALSGPSRLKRSKIMPSNVKKNWELEDIPRPKKENWQIQKAALREKFPEGWKPRKRLSPDALEGIRALHKQYPMEYTTEVLSQKFAVSPEVIRRILRAKWQPSAEEEEKRQERWFNRGKSIWAQMAELGTKPPKKWREEGVVRDPRWNKKQGPRTDYPYAPRKLPEEQESTQRRLGGSLL